MDRQIIECPLGDSILGVPDTIAMHLMDRHGWEFHKAAKWLREKMELNS